MVKALNTDIYGCTYFETEVAVITFMDYTLYTSVYLACIYKLVRDTIWY